VREKIILYTIVKYFKENVPLFIKIYILGVMVPHLISTPVPNRRWCLSKEESWPWHVRMYGIS
jgi:hypothetical protein